MCHNQEVALYAGQWAKGGRNSSRPVDSKQLECSKVGSEVIEAGIMLEIYLGYRERQLS